MPSLTLLRVQTTDSSTLCTNGTTIILYSAVSYEQNSSPASQHSYSIDSCALLLLIPPLCNTNWPLSAPHETCDTSVYVVEIPGYSPRFYLVAQWQRDTPARIVFERQQYSSNICFRNLRAQSFCKHTWCPVCYVIWQIIHNSQLSLESRTIFEHHG